MTTSYWRYWWTTYKLLKRLECVEKLLTSPPHWKPYAQNYCKKCCRKHRTQMMKMILLSKSMYSKRTTWISLYMTQSMTNISNTKIQIFLLILNQSLLSIRSRQITWRCLIWISTSQRKTMRLLDEHLLTRKHTLCWIFTLVVPSCWLMEVLTLSSLWLSIMQKMTNFWDLRDFCSDIDSTLISFFKCLKSLKLTNTMLHKKSADLATWSKIALIRL